MSEMMQQLGKAQEEVRRLAAKVDRHEKVIRKFEEEEDKLKEEVERLSDGTNGLFSDFGGQPGETLRGLMERMAKENDGLRAQVELLEETDRHKAKYLHAKMVVTVEEFKRRFEDAVRLWEGEDGGSSGAHRVVAYLHEWLTVTLPPSE